jgi:ABC-2 type transport system permease protein
MGADRWEARGYWLPGQYCRAPLSGGNPSFEMRVHRLDNPEGVTQYNIVPALMGVILATTTALMTRLAMTRERERGTMENLLATPALPVEVMTGRSSLTS